jgi:hypothetical protein
VKKMAHARSATTVAAFIATLHKKICASETVCLHIVAMQLRKCWLTKQDLTPSTQAL